MPIHLTSPAAKALHLLTYSWLTYSICCRSDAALIIHNSYTPNRSPVISTDETFAPLLHHSDLVIDKTLFLKSILEDTSKAIFIGCPRRWGKSVNLDMLKTFLSVEFDDKGNRLPLNTTSSYRLFVKGEVIGINGTVRLKKPPLISYHKGIVNQFMDKRPVIHLNMRSCSFSFSSMVGDLHENLKRTFDDHIYILYSYKQILRDTKAYNFTKAHAREMEYFFYKYRFQTPTNLTVNYVFEMLDAITEALYEHFGEKIFVLVDECFNAWNGMLSKSTLGEDEKSNYLNFYTDFMTALLKDNVYVEKVILMDTLPIPQDLRETAFSQVTECNSLNGKFMEYFGINQWELNDLFHYLSIPNDTLHNASAWYSGHQVNGRDLKHSNMISITKFLSSREYQYYSMTQMYVNTFVKNFFKIPQFDEKFRTLCTSEDIYLKLNHKRFTWNNYEHLLKAVYREVHCHESLVPMAFMFLYHNGYLTLSENCSLDSQSYRMKFPNEEVRSYMKLILDEADRRKELSTTLSVPQIIQPFTTRGHLVSQMKTPSNAFPKQISPVSPTPNTTSVLANSTTVTKSDTSTSTAHSHGSPKQSSSPSGILATSTHISTKITSLSASEKPTHSSSSPKQPSPPTTQRSTAKTTHSSDSPKIISSNPPGTVATSMSTKITSLSASHKAASGGSPKQLSSTSASPSTFKNSTLTTLAP